MRKNHIILLLLTAIFILLGKTTAYAANSDYNFCSDRAFSTHIQQELSGTVKVSSGKTYYVSPKGKNNWNGTKRKPFRTISYAAKKLKAGDTLYVRGGTYQELPVLSSSVSGSKNKYITISSYSGEKVIISGKGKKSPTLFRMNGSSYLRIHGLTFANASGADACGIFLASGTHHIILSENTIQDISVKNPKSSSSCANGILLFGESSKKSIHDILIYKNKLTNCKTGWTECLSVTANCTNINIISNELKNIGNIGIDLSGNYGYCSTPKKDFPRNCLVASNTVTKCISPNATAYGIYVDGGQHITISDNKVTKCSGGIEIGAEQKPSKTAYSTSDITISSNTIKNNIKNGITIGGYTKKLGWVKDVTISDNICENNGKNNAILTLAKCSNVQISGNSFRNTSGDAAIVYASFSKNSTKNIVFKNNIYFNGHKKTKTNFVYLGKEYTSFEQWKKAAGKNAGTYR